MNNKKRIKKILNTKKINSKSCEDILFYFSKKIKQNKIPKKYFFDFLKLIKIPDKYCLNFLNNLDSSYLGDFAIASNKKLPINLENKFFKKLINENSICKIVEYHYYTKEIPNYVHNFLISYCLVDSNDMATKAYLLNLKAINNKI